MNRQRLADGSSLALSVPPQKLALQAWRFDMRANKNRQHKPGELRISDMPYQLTVFVRIEPMFL